MDFHNLIFFSSADRHTKQKRKKKKEKKQCQSEDLISTGVSKLPIALGKMADFGERKENCHFSGLAAEEGKTFISKVLV